MNRRLLLFVPLAAVAAGGTAFFAMLQREQRGTFDPRAVPSMLIGKRVPAFTLYGLTDADLRGPLLVNFFASWCAPCVEEAPILMDLHRAGVKLIGIAYKDKPAATDAFLARRGNPFTRLARDEPGRVAIDWGVTGVPETYLIDPAGVVRWRWAGALTPEVVTAELQPMLRKYA